MKKIVAAAVMTLWFMPTGALANPVGNERVGGAALGAVAGALVLGPVGAVVGAAVGFAAAPSVANGFKQAEPPPQQQPAKPARNAAPRAVPLPQAKPAQAKPAQAKSAASEAKAQARVPVKPAAHADAAARQVPH